MGRASGDLGNMVNVLYFDCDGNYTGVYIRQNSLNGAASAEHYGSFSKIKYRIPGEPE